MEIDENEVELHINTSQHLENKSKVPVHVNGFGKSVSSMWKESLD